MSMLAGAAYLTPTWAESAEQEEQEDKRSGLRNTLHGKWQNPAIKIGSPPRCSFFVTELTSLRMTASRFDRAHYARSSTIGEIWNEEDCEQKHAIAPASGNYGGERRAKQRIVQAFPARVWAVDAAGFPFNLDCVLDNLSSTGTYLRLSRQMKQEADISLVVQLLCGPSTGTPVVIYGKVLRDEIRANGQHGIAVAIKKYKFL